MEKEFAKKTRTDIYNIDPRAIVVVADFNSRVDFGNIDELAEEIKAQGMLNPITVLPFTEDGVEKYKLVDGERRYRAVMKLISDGVDIARIKANFVSKSISQEELFVQQFARNEGKPFTEYELGILCAKLRDKCGKTISEIADLLGKNVGVISYALADLEYDPRVQQMLKDGVTTGSNVRRVYQAYKNEDGTFNEEGAVSELLGLKEKAVENGRKTISLKDCNKDDAYFVKKDTKMALAGLSVIRQYKDMYPDVKITLNQLYNMMSTEKKTIKEAFEEASEFKKVD